MVSEPTTKLDTTFFLSFNPIIMEPPRVLAKATTVSIVESLKLLLNSSCSPSPWAMSLSISAFSVLLFAAFYLQMGDSSKYTDLLRIGELNPNADFTDGADLHGLK